ncbi:hypothetical protein GLYMA_03G135450v4 [Glycine max]|nr:hypothetical protein GLYMA_03G135450v4 [Glycine max]
MILKIFLLLVGFFKLHFVGDPCSYMYVSLTCKPYMCQATSNVQMHELECRPLKKNKQNPLFQIQKDQNFNFTFQFLNLHTMESGVLVSSELKQDRALSNEGAERSDMVLWNLGSRGGNPEPLSGGKDCSGSDADAEGV